VSETFSNPYWCHRAFDYMPLIPFLIILYIETSFLTIMCFLVAFLLLSYVYYYHGGLARTIEVSQDGVKGFTYNRSVVEIKWGEITELIEKKKYLLSSFSLIQLVANNKKKKITFIEKIKDFGDLLTIIDQNTINLKKTKTHRWI